MNDRHIPEPFSLSFWMDGAENGKLGGAAHKWFSLLGRAAFWGVFSQEPLTCGPAALDLIAWQRGVRRYAGEPERLYRLRVHFAYENAKDAGGIAGWHRIFERLELLRPGELKLEERIAGQDWDIIGIVLSDARMAELQDILERVIIEEYGRTCRRYRLVSRTLTEERIRVGVFNNDHCTVMAALPDAPATLPIATGGAAFGNEFSLEVAWA